MQNVSACVIISSINKMYNACTKSVLELQLEIFQVDRDSNEEFKVIKNDRIEIYY